jgi:phage gpG-like protein
MAEIIGFERLVARLEEMRARARDASPALDDAADLALESIGESFDVGGRPAWAPHALSTLANQIGPRRLLIEHGDLQGSFQKRVSATSASVFPTDWKAVFHEMGTQMHGQQHIPARPFMHLQQPGDISAIGKLFGEYLFQ